MNVPEKVISIEDIDDATKKYIRNAIAEAVARSIADKAIKQVCCGSSETEESA